MKNYHILIFLFLLSWLMPCPAHAQPAPDQAILFQCDFESPNWFQEWGERKQDVHTDTVASDPALKFEPHRGKALRIKVDKDGHYGASLEYAFKKRTGSEPEEIYFRYYLRFADDWKPEQGGKLPGIGGTYGRAGWGGRPVNGKDGWSARGLFHGQKDGKTPIGYYCYHADMKGQYGSEWRWDIDQRGRLENNRWYCVEQYVRLNTPGKNDGILRGWVDGQPAFEKTDVRMRDVDTLKIETVWLNVYYGGTWEAKADYHVYIDDVAISRKPIGPTAPATASSSSTAAVTAAVWPGARWETATPESVGLDSAKLAQARDYALTGGGSGYIIRHGKRVMTWGDLRQLYDLKSSTKSFGSIALGLALMDGKVRLEDKAKGLYPAFGSLVEKKAPPELKDAPVSATQTAWLNEITILHLASQSAGFEKPGGSNKLLFRPGTFWAYSDSGPNWLADCLTLAYRRDLDELVFERVFTPLGITRQDLVWRKNSYRPEKLEKITRREFGAGISANVDALARIGYMMLHEGTWNGREILPREYARTSPHVWPGHEKLPTWGRDEHGKTAASHYGLLWWNNDDGALRGVPRDAFWSWGLYDSFIFVVPSLDLVVTRAGQSWKRNEEEPSYRVLEPFFGVIAQAAQKQVGSATRHSEKSLMLKKENGED